MSAAVPVGVPVAREAEKDPGAAFFGEWDVRVSAMAIGVLRWVRDGMVSSQSATGREGGEIAAGGDVRRAGLRVMRGPEGPGVTD